MSRLAELPGEHGLVVPVRHAGDGVGAGQHIADRRLVVVLDLGVGVKLLPLLAAMGGVRADAPQVVARLGRKVEDHPHAVAVGQREQMVHRFERLVVELAGALHVMPGHAAVGRFVFGIADRQVPQPHDAQIHLVQRLEGVFLLPRRGQMQPLGEVQRPVVGQDQPRHVRADEAEFPVAVHQLVALAGDEVGKAAGRFGVSIRRH